MMMTLLLAIMGSPIDTKWQPDTRISTEIQWHNELQIAFGFDRGFYLASPRENTIWLVDKDGKTRHKKRFSDSGFSLVSVTSLDNGHLRAFFVDEVYRPIIFDLDSMLEKTQTYHIGKDLIYHQNLQFSLDGKYVLSRNEGTYDAEFPERQVSQSLLDLKGNLVHRFSQHQEGGRLYINTDTAMLYDFLKERVRGFYAPHAVVNFSGDGTLIHVQSHEGKQVFVFDVNTKKSDLLITLPVLTPASKIQTKAVANFLLEERVLKKLPSLQIEGGQNDFLQKLAQDPDMEIDMPKVWGIFAWTPMVYGVITHLNYATGDQTCLLFTSEGKMGEITLPHWAFVGPEQEPKVSAKGNRLALLQPNPTGGNAIIETKDWNDSP